MSVEGWKARALAQTGATLVPCQKFFIIPAISVSPCLRRQVSYDLEELAWAQSQRRPKASRKMMGALKRVGQRQEDRGKREENSDAVLLQFLRKTT